MDIKIPYKPRDWQLEAQKILNRFTVLVLHRRAGKTVFNVIQNIIGVLNCPHSRPQGSYIAPTYSQAKKIAWDYYKEFLEPLRLKNLVTFNESSLRIDFSSGAKIYLLGAEEPDAIRGMYMDHVVLDEYQLMPADFFEKIIRPLLSDRKGKAILSGTPHGKNHFYDAYSKGFNDASPDWSSFLRKWNETNTLAREEIEAAKRDMSDEAFYQEYECSFDAAIRGSYFGKNIARLRIEDRLKEFKYDPRYPVVTGWDIGFDGTVVWYAQKIGEQIKIVDCDIFEDKDIPYVANKVLNKPYTYQYQILPNADGNRRSNLDRRKTPKGHLESLGLKVKIAPKVERDTGIQATRVLIDRAVFSSDCDKKLKLGRVVSTALELLSLYRAEYDETTGVTQTTPVHDRSSHVADALRTLATGIKDTNLEVSVNVRDRQTSAPLINNKWNPFNRR